MPQARPSRGMRRWLGELAGGPGCWPAGERERVPSIWLRCYPEARRFMHPVRSQRAKYMVHHMPEHLQTIAVASYCFICLL